MRLLHVALAASLIVTVAAQSQTSLAGKWTLKFKTVAEQPTCCAEVTLIVKIEGPKISGTAIMGDWPGEAPFTTGTITDGHFVLTAVGQLTSSSGYPKIGFDGTIQGDTMKVTMSMGSVGSETVWRKWEMTGERAKK